MISTPVSSLSEMIVKTTVIVRPTMGTMMARRIMDPHWITVHGANPERKNTAKDTIIQTTRN